MANLSSCLVVCGWRGTLPGGALVDGTHPEMLTPAILEGIEPVGRIIRWRYHDAPPIARACAVSPCMADPGGRPMSALSLRHSRRYCTGRQLYHKESRGECISFAPVPYIGDGNADVTNTSHARQILRTHDKYFAQNMADTPHLPPLLYDGGEGGIRTHETVARLRHFQCRALGQLCDLSRKQLAISSQ